jgi:uncharacterized protein (TIGR02118 family)
MEEAKVFVVGVLYPPSARFDLKYYLDTHIPLVQSCWGQLGLKDVRVLRGKGGPGSDAAIYATVALLSFEHHDSFQEAVKQHGKEVMGDIRNFTDAEPVMQFFEPVG